MQLAERHIIKSTKPRFAPIDGLAFQSKNLYNAANYVIRQSFVYGWGYINYNEMNRLKIVSYLIVIPKQLEGFSAARESAPQTRCLAPV